MRTSIPIAELIGLAQEAARRGHYGTFAYRLREMGGAAEEKSFKDGYRQGQNDKILTDKTQHKPLVNVNKDKFSAWGLYNQLTEAVNDGHWEPETVLKTVRDWLAEQDQRDLTFMEVMNLLHDAKTAATAMKQAEE